jgi:hypothetical protein
MRLNSPKNEKHYVVPSWLYQILFYSKRLRSVVLAVTHFGGMRMPPSSRMTSAFM